DAAAAAAGAAAAGVSTEPVQTMEFWSSLTYKEAVSPATARYARSMLAGTLLGQKCPTCAKVFVPPRDFCSIDGIRLDEGHDLALPDRGVITNFTIVTPVPYPGQKETEPFVRVSVLLDDVEALMGLQPVVDIPNEEVRVGMRVEAVWLPESERNAEEFGNRGWGSTTGAISGWRATGEPDLPVERYIDRVF
ncbi:Zn-ribbon domain-containing OB-fold protein, partial [Frankia nepalensis]